MKPYLLSLGVGILVGLIYAAFKVKAPAPPVIALVGLFGMLIGQQIIPLVERHVFHTEPDALQEQEP
jgi:XapX domain-containing protein